jgi:hypothetical protein
MDFFPVNVDLLDKSFKINTPVNMDLSLLIQLNLKGFFARKNLKIFKIFKRRQGATLSPLVVVFLKM